MKINKKSSADVSGFVGRNVYKRKSNFVEIKNNKLKDLVNILYFKKTS